MTQFIYILQIIFEGISSIENRLTCSVLLGTLSMAYLFIKRLSYQVVFLVSLYLKCCRSIKSTVEWVKKYRWYYRYCLYNMNVNKKEILKLVASLISYEVIQRFRNLNATIQFERDKLKYIFIIIAPGLMRVTCHWYKWGFITRQKHYYIFLDELEKMWDANSLDRFEQFYKALSDDEENKTKCVHLKWNEWVHLVIIVLLYLFNVIYFLYKYIIFKFNAIKWSMFCSIYRTIIKPLKVHLNRA